MASQIIAESTPLPRPLNLPKVGDPWAGGKATNSEAEALVDSLLSWAGQFQHPEAHKLVAGLKDIQKLFSTVTTEIDEALVLLKFAEKGYGTPEEHRKTAMAYLSRWQDRHGQMGNFQF